MDIEAIVSLMRDINQDMLYDFFVIEYELSRDITFYTFTVRREHEMRLGLVMEEIYGIYNDRDMGIICEINDLDNPLNVMEGDVIYYCDLDVLGEIRTPDVSNETSTTSNNKLTNPSKLKQTDNKRQEYINNNFSLNPNYNNGAPNISVNQNKITIRKS